MKKDFKAIATMVAGTIGVGFVALPYAFSRFGTFGGIVVLIVVTMITIVTNLAYADIVTSDKGNRQIPGYVKKYLGDLPSHLISLIVILGSLGILLAYGLISGTALLYILSKLGMKFSAAFFSLIFIIASLAVMRFGMGFISKVSSYAVIALVVAIILLILVSLPSVNLENISELKFTEFSSIFGICIFSMYSTASVPILDEIIGYEKKRYRKIIVISNLLTLFIYIVFSLIASLSLGDLINGDLISAYASKGEFVTIVFSLIILLASFTSFVIVANSIKEILNYDYKLGPKLTILIIFTTLIWMLMLNLFNFESLLSEVGNLSLAVQSLAIFAIWYKSQKKGGLSSQLVIGICAILLLAGIFSQI